MVVIHEQGMLSRWAAVRNDFQTRAGNRAFDSRFDLFQRFHFSTVTSITLAPGLAVAIPPGYSAAQDHVHHTAAREIRSALPPPGGAAVQTRSAPARQFFAAKS